MSQRSTTWLLSISCVVCVFLSRGALAQQSEIPREWIDPDTGHRVIRLSDEPGSASLYFHQNAYTPDGQKLIITTPGGLSTIDLKTRAIEKIVEAVSASSSSAERRARFTTRAVSLPTT